MVKVYVEGGGDHNRDLSSRCRKGFKQLFEKTDLKGKMPKIIPCGRRNNAYDSFCTAIKQGDDAFLLVDSEDLVDPTNQKGNPDQWKPWAHLQQRDGWKMPNKAKDIHCHLMVPCMEAWLISDRETLKDFFGKKNFNEKKLPHTNNAIERVSKKELYTALKETTKESQKGQYGKGPHSFDLLSKIDPYIVMTRSPWAKRLIDTLKEL